MFEPTPELDSDLEWMLQSGQASSGMLLEAFVHEYYIPVYHLALSVLDDAPAARAAAGDTFIAALLNLYRYRSQTGAQNWLYSIALDTIHKAFIRLKTRRTLKATLPLPRGDNDFGASTPHTELDASIWLAVDALDEASRLILLLHSVLGWTVQEIGDFLKASSEEATARLNRVYQDLLDSGLPVEAQPAAPILALHAALSGAEVGMDSGELSQVAVRVKRSLNERWPAPQVSEAEMQELIAGLSKKAEKRGRRRTGYSHVKEIAFTAVAILIAIGSIWAYHLVSPDSATLPPDRTKIVTKIVYEKVTATPPSGLETTANQTFGVVIVQPNDTLAAIAARTGTTVEELRKLNRIPLEVGMLPNQWLLLPSRQSLSPLPTPTPAPASTELAPLSQNASSRDILQRIAGPSLFNAPVWMDVLNTDYGPVGYIGPPKVQRAQVWVSKNQSLVLIGAPQNDLQMVFLRTQNHTYLARPDQGQPWFSEWRQDQPDAVNSLTTFMNGLVDIRDISLFSSLIQTGREPVAGRDALKISQWDNTGKLVSRLWLDDRTGLVLRRITYNNGDILQPLKEENVMAVAYGVNFPQDLFDSRLPWRGGFASNYGGLPIPVDTPPLPLETLRMGLPKASPADTTDPAKSALSFEYPSQADNLISAQVTVYAGNRKIGTTIFGNPWSTICQRSPDGKLIAYVSQPSNGDTYEPDLRWFSVEDSISQVHKPLTTTAVTQFAFAPDSHRLAIFGYPDPKGFGNLYIYDTNGGAVQSIFQTADAKSLVWSPDGKYLALIARTQPHDFRDTVLILDVATGKAVYSAGVDLENSASQNWPTNKWGVEFPVEMGDLGASAAAPK